MTLHIIKKYPIKHMQGQIKVYECETRESKYGKDNYFAVIGKMGGLTTTFISDIALPAGEHEVALSLSEYQGKLGIRITKKL